MHTTSGCDSFCHAFENFCGQRQIDSLYFSICKAKEFSLLPNRTDVLPVNMRCTRAVVGSVRSCLPWCLDVFEECAVFSAGFASV